MSDFSRSRFWEDQDEDSSGDAPDQNWKLEAMENAIRRYLSGPDSPPIGNNTIVILQSPYETTRY